MPTYDYKCHPCGIKLETSHSFKELTGQEPKCANCNQEMKRMVSKPSVHFKGTGFYETDYKGK